MFGWIIHIWFVFGLVMDVYTRRFIMLSLACLISILVSVSGAFHDDVEFAPPVPDFPGIDPQLVLSALANAPDSAAVTSDVSNSPPASFSSSANPSPISFEILSSTNGSPETFAPPASPSDVSLSPPAEFPEPNTEEFSPATSNAESFAQEVPETPHAFAPPPPPPPSHNVIDIPDSAVIPIAQPSYSPAPSSQSSASSNSPAAPHSEYGPPGYSPSPVLSSYKAREDERYHHDARYYATRRNTVSNRSPKAAKHALRHSAGGSRRLYSDYPSSGEHYLLIRYPNVRSVPVQRPQSRKTS